MKKWLIYAALAAASLFGAASPALAQDAAAATPASDAPVDSVKSCPSSPVFNPVANTDWNNMFPITIMGVRMGANTNPPLMYEPPVCVCPGLFGIPSVGFGVTFWQPLYIVEIERTAGCMQSLGGTSILKSAATKVFNSLSSEQADDSGNAGSHTSRMQIHWYEYPVFAMLDIFKKYGCFNASGFDLGYMTELDYTWQDDTWAVMFSPEAAFFSDPILQASCAIDTVAATVGFPISPMFWCMGYWGGTYPMSGNSQHGNSPFQRNNSIMGKFLARQARLGMQWATVGPTAQCFAHPTPIWIKEQYRINQVAPIPRRGKPLYIGGSEIGQFPPNTNYPTHESTVNLIWQGMQCCERAY